MCGSKRRGTEPRKVQSAMVSRYSLFVGCGPVSWARSNQGAMDSILDDLTPHLCLTGLGWCRLCAIRGVLALEVRVSRSQNNEEGLEGKLYGRTPKCRFLGNWLSALCLRKRDVSYEIYGWVFVAPDFIQVDGSCFMASNGDGRAFEGDYSASGSAI